MQKIVTAGWKPTFQQGFALADHGNKKSRAASCGRCQVERARRLLAGLALGRSRQWSPGAKTKWGSGPFISNRHRRPLVRPMASAAAEVPLVCQFAPKSIGTNIISGGGGVAGPNKGGRRLPNPLIVNAGTFLSSSNATYGGNTSPYHSFHLQAAIRTAHKNHLQHPWSNLVVFPSCCLCFTGLSPPLKSRYLAPRQIYPLPPTMGSLLGD